MNNLPAESQKSFKTGNWFVFQDNQNIIHFWVSNKNGQEKLFLNGNLVSTAKKMFKMKTEHAVEDENGVAYKVILKVIREGRTARTVCGLYKDEVLIRQMEIRPNEKGAGSIRRSVYMMAAVAVISGLAASAFDLKLSYVLPITITMALAIMLFTLKKIDGSTDLVDTTDML